jgi:hypothetical protein
MGRRQRLLREKAQNKRMKNPSLTAQESLQDEVAYVMTTASLLKNVEEAVKMIDPKDGNLSQIAPAQQPL